MPEFNAGHALDEAMERHSQIAEGGILVPVAAAIIAVLAALGTLFANHNSIAGLAAKNEAILYQIKSADQYAYYESSRVKTHVYQAILGSGVVAASAQKPMQATIARENVKAEKIQKVAQEDDTEAAGQFKVSENFMRAYEKFEVATTLFEVSIVLVSITALMRTRAMLFVAAGATLVGVVFFGLGFLP
jgi:uncharacterized protein DUF4337